MKPSINSRGIVTARCKVIVEVPGKEPVTHKMLYDPAGKQAMRLLATYQVSEMINESVGYTRTGVKITVVGGTLRWLGLLSSPLRDFVDGWLKELGLNAWQSIGDAN